MERPRKAPAVERSIKEITAQDIKVRVTGTVAETRDDGFLTLEDESGKVQVETQEIWKKGAKVRVFARPTMIKGELVLSADIVQDMSSLDEKLYKKSQSLRIQ